MDTDAQRQMIRKSLHGLSLLCDGKIRIHIVFNTSFYPSDMKIENQCAHQCAIRTDYFFIKFIYITFRVIF